MIWKTPAVIYSEGTIFPSNSSFPVLRSELKALYMLCKYLTTELQPTEKNNSQTALDMNKL